MKIGKARFGCVFGVMLALSGPLWAVESATATPLRVAADDDLDYGDEDDGELEEAAPRPDIGQLRHWLNQRNRQRQGGEESMDDEDDSAQDDADDDTDSELIDTGRVWKSRPYAHARYGKRHYRGHRWHGRRSHRHHGFWHGHGRWQGRGHRHWHGDHRARHKKIVAIAHAQGRRGGHHAVPAVHGRSVKAATTKGKRLAASTPAKATPRVVAAHLPAKSFKPVKSPQNAAKTTKATSSKASAPKPSHGKGKHR